MAGFAEYHLSPPLVAALEALGWRESDRLARDCVPIVARGHSLLIAIPPAASYAAPALAGVLGRSVPGAPPVLILCPEAALAEWGEVAAPLALAAGLSFHIVTGPARTSRRLRQESLGVLVISPERALALQRRSALKLDATTQLVLAWPELLESPAVLEPLMQDLPKEAQRLLVTTDLAGVQPLAQRYLWKAPCVGEAPRALDSAAARRIQVVTISREARSAALLAVLDLLDPSSVTIWVADAATRVWLAARLRGAVPEAQVVSGDAPLPPADLIVAYDLPESDRLQQLVQAAPVAQLAPGYALPYLSRVAPGHGTLRLPGITESAEARAAARRATIVRTLEAAPSDGALLALAPLFERYEPAAIAAALYDLWTRTAAPAEAATGAGEPFGEIPATARLWIGVGQKDGVTPDDLVAALIREAGVNRGAIGKIEIRQLYSLVELPARQIEAIGQALNGVSIRRRRVTARVDRGAGRAAARPRER
jgi:ATP-dependent RNA helicase DeaD